MNSNAAVDRFKFFTEIIVRISDINYGGHLGNDRYLSLFHDARIRYLQRSGYSEFHIGTDVGLIMLESHVQYKAEAWLGDGLTIGVCISEIKPVKFLMEYIILRPSDNVLVATGFTRMAAYNYAMKKVEKLPPDFIAKIQMFEGID